MAFAPTIMTDGIDIERQGGVVDWDRLKAMDAANRDGSHLRQVHGMYKLEQAKLTRQAAKSGIVEPELAANVHKHYLALTEALNKMVGAPVVVLLPDLVVCRKGTVISVSLDFYGPSGSLDSRMMEVKIENGEDGDPLYTWARPDDLRFWKVFDAVSS